MAAPGKKQRSAEDMLRVGNPEWRRIPRGKTWLRKIHDILAINMKVGRRDKHYNDSSITNSNIQNQEDERKLETQYESDDKKETELRSTSFTHYEGISRAKFWEENISASFVVNFTNSFLTLISSSTYRIKSHDVLRLRINSEPMALIYSLLFCIRMPVNGARRKGLSVTWCTVATFVRNLTTCTNVWS
jgi:hypothetical protein